MSGARTVYVGKASLGAAGKRGVRKGLNEFRKYGVGSHAAGHAGGRRIWPLTTGRLAGHDDIEAAMIETEMIAEFRVHYGFLPFANMRN